MAGNARAAPGAGGTHDGVASVLKPIAVATALAVLVAGGYVWDFRPDLMARITGRKLAQGETYTVMGTSMARLGKGVAYRDVGSDCYLTSGMRVLAVGDDQPGTLLRIVDSQDPQTCQVGDLVFVPTWDGRRDWQSQTEIDRDAKTTEIAARRRARDISAAVDRLTAGKGVP